MRHIRKSNTNSRQGSSSIEFALVAPIMFGVIFMAFDFSRISMMRALAQSAAYGACRSSIVDGATRAEAIAEAERVLARLGTKNAIISVNKGQEITEETTEVTVSVDIPLGDNSFFFKPYFTGSSVSSEITLKTERYTGYFDSSEL